MKNYRTTHLLAHAPQWALLSASVALAACGGGGGSGSPVVFPSILESRGGVAQEGELQLDGARALASFSIDSTPYLAVAGSRAGGVSIFSVGDDGLLDNVLNQDGMRTRQDDSEESVSFAGASDIVVKASTTNPTTDAFVYVAANNAPNEDAEGNAEAAGALNSFAVTNVNGSLDFGNANGDTQTQQLSHGSAGAGLAELNLQNVGALSAVAGDNHTDLLLSSNFYAQFMSVYRQGEGDEGDRIARRLGATSNGTNQLGGTGPVFGLASARVGESDVVYATSFDDDTLGVFTIDGDGVQRGVTDPALGTLADNPDVSATEIGTFPSFGGSAVQQTVHSTVYVPDVIYVDITLPDTLSSDNEVLFEVGAAPGATLYINGDDLLFTIDSYVANSQSQNDNYDIRANDVFEPGKRYAIAVELYGENDLALYVSEFAGGQLPAPTQVATDELNGDHQFGAGLVITVWANGNDGGWGRVSDDESAGFAQGPGPYARFSGTFNEGRFYDQKRLSEVWTVDTDAVYEPPEGSEYTFTDDGERGSLALQGAVAVTTGVIGETTYVFAAGYVDDGISVFRTTNEGTRLINVANIRDGDNERYQLDGVLALEFANINGTAYLFAAGFLDGGISTFRVEFGRQSNQRLARHGQRRVAVERCLGLRSGGSQRQPLPLRQRLRGRRRADFCDQPLDCL